MHKNKKAIIIAVSLLILGGASFAYYQDNKPYGQNPSGEYIAEDVPTSAEKIQSKDEESPKNQPADQPQPNKSTNNFSTTSSLYKPTGNFVSSHVVEPGSTIESVCITTPGAKCKIIFTNGSNTKVLNAKTTDSEGTTAWIWQPKKLGISGGKWQIKAEASLNSQTKTSKDAKLLEVL